MTREEYEQRKRRLEEQHLEGMALLEAGYRQQLRALELVWMTSAEEDLVFPVRRTPEPVAVPSEPPSLEPVAPDRPRHRTPWELIQDLAAAFPSLPEVFDRNHLCETLGYSPDRGALYRILQQLVERGNLAVQHPGRGKMPTIYRKTGADIPFPGM